MKKLLIAILILITTSASAQKKSIKQGKNLFFENKADSALVLFKESIKNPKTENNPFAWYYIGRIYFKQADEESRKDTSSEVLDLSYEAFKNAEKFGIKKKYRKYIHSFYNSLGAMFYNEGVRFYEQSNHKESAFSFHYSSLIYKDKDTALSNKAQKYCLYSATQAFNDYLAQKNYEKALLYTELLLKQSPKKDIFYYALGSVHQYLYEQNEKEFHFTEADKAFGEAILLNPNYFDALYNLGALYYNRAAKIYDEAFSIYDEKEYQKKIEEAEGFMLKAIKPLEQAMEIDSNDEHLLRTLKNCYFKTKQMDKYNELKK